jgi:DNA invertase Pin-like site-specific DNA recombinase
MTGIPAVLYAVKSSPDEKGSVDDQQRIIREAIDDDSRIIATFGEENQSGYRKERGPQLEAAMQAAQAAAAEHGESEIWVWHSSRLARGDGTRGQRSVMKVVADLLYEGVIVRSATDPEMVTPMLAGIASKVANKYSEDLSGWTKTGLARRRRSGKPMGALPGLGYEVERKIVDNRPVSRRIVHPTGGPFAVAVFERIAAGQTPGVVGRWLNEQGVRTIRGAPFNQRTIRKIIANDAFTGGNGYPRIVTDELAHRARGEIKRLDPAEIQRRKGGRRPTEPYMLRSVAFCAGCNAALYRSYARGNGRTYVCRNQLEATGLCSLPPIPAIVLETHVLNHVQTFIGSVEGWIAERLAERSGELTTRQTALNAERAKLAVLGRQRDQRMSEIAEHGITSPIALELIERIDRDRESQALRITEAEAVLSEWTSSPDVNDALEFYDRLSDHVLGRLKQADGVVELNEALSGVLAGLWCEIDQDRQRLLVRFAMRNLTTEQPLELPPADLAPQPIEPLGWSTTTTPPLTTVSACLP